MQTNNIQNMKIILNTTHEWRKQFKSCISLLCKKLTKVGYHNYLHHQTPVSLIPIDCPCLKLNYPSPIPWGQFLGKWGSLGDFLMKYPPYTLKFP